MVRLPSVSPFIVLLLNTDFAYMRNGLWWSYKRAWLDRIFQMWIQNLLRNSLEDLAEKLTSHYYPGTPAAAVGLSNGAFNICYRVTYKNDHHVLFASRPLVGFVLAMKKGWGWDRKHKLCYSAHNDSCSKNLRTWQVFGPYIAMSFVEG